MYKISEDYLTINEFSRPGTKIDTVKGIVIHWVANARTSAKANRNFYEMRKEGQKGYGSAHYLINLDGTVIIDIPEDEVAYHIGVKSLSERALKNLGSNPDHCTLGIKCTHLDNQGKMSEQTYNSLIELCTDLIKKYQLDPWHDLYLHYEITGNECHKWFVDNPGEWKKLKQTISHKINQTRALPEKPASNSDETGETLVTRLIMFLKEYFKDNPAEWQAFKQSIENKVN